MPRTVNECRVWRRTDYIKTMKWTRYNYKEEREYKNRDGAWIKQTSILHTVTNHKGYSTTINRTDKHILVCTGMLCTGILGRILKLSNELRNQTTDLGVVTTKSSSSDFGMPSRNKSLFGETANINYYQALSAADERY